MKCIDCIAVSITSSSVISSRGFTREAARYFPELSFACLKTNNGWRVVKRLTFIRGQVGWKLDSECQVNYLCWEWMQTSIPHYTCKRKKLNSIRVMRGHALTDHSYIFVVTNGSGRVLCEVMTVGITEYFASVAGFCGGRCIARIKTT